MNDEKTIFIDTNVLIYAYSSDEVEKNETVSRLIAEQQKILYSEDMHHKHMISKELIILNPFA